MSYVASPEEKVRKLRAVRAAVASALGNGIPEAEVLRAVEAGVAWEQEIQATKAGGRPSRFPNEESASGGLDALERAVGLRR
jgi:hypothetical protein